MLRRQISSVAWGLGTEVEPTWSRRMKSTWKVLLLPVRNTRVSSGAEGRPGSYHNGLGMPNQGGVCPFKITNGNYKGILREGGWLKKIMCLGSHYTEIPPGKLHKLTRQEMWGGETIIKENTIQSGKQQMP